jgi:hypothetical protein
MATTMPTFAELTLRLYHLNGRSHDLCVSSASDLKSLDSEITALCSVFGLKFEHESLYTGHQSVARLIGYNNNLPYY